MITLLSAAPSVAPAFPASANIEAILRLALAEDIGRGDITTEATISSGYVTAPIRLQPPQVGEKKSSKTSLPDSPAWPQAAWRSSVQSIALMTSAPSCPRQ